MGQFCIGVCGSTKISSAFHEQPL